MDKKINILIVVMVLVLSLSIAYMFLSINMQENKNPPVVNITNNVGTKATMKLIIVATLWMRILNGIWMKDLISRCIVWMKFPVVNGKFIIQKMAADGMNIMIK